MEKERITFTHYPKSQIIHKSPQFYCDYNSYEIAIDSNNHNVINEDGSLRLSTGMTLFIRKKGYDEYEEYILSSWIGHSENEILEKLTKDYDGDLSGASKTNENGTETSPLK